jgi:hypothetical protein
MAEEIWGHFFFLCGLRCLFPVPCGGVLQGDAGVCAEVGLRGCGDSEKVGDGGIEVAVREDGWMAEDIHQKSVGAIGAVQFPPVPVGSCTNSGVSGVDLGKTPGPVWIGADSSIACRVKVAVTPMFVLLLMAEDDARLRACSLFMEEPIGDGEVLGASVQVATEKRGRPCCGGWVGVGHKRVLVSCSLCRDDD